MCRRKYAKVRRVFSGVEREKRKEAWSKGGLRSPPPDPFFVFLPVFFFPLLFFSPLHFFMFFLLFFLLCFTRPHNTPQNCFSVFSFLRPFLLYSIVPPPTPVLPRNHLFLQPKGSNRLRPPHLQLLLLYCGKQTFSLLNNTQTAIYLAPPKTKLINFSFLFFFYYVRRSGHSNESLPGEISI